MRNNWHYFAFLGIVVVAAIVGTWAVLSLRNQDTCELPPSEGPWIRLEAMGEPDPDENSLARFRFLIHIGGDTSWSLRGDDVINLVVHDPGSNDPIDWTRHDAWRDTTFPFTMREEPYQKVLYAEWRRCEDGELRIVAQSPEITITVPALPQETATLQ